uniref:Uncharacterized protein n=1 Tax=Steinernema glaseri TaxID=37863 RepID=A0A1I7ZRU3_9BILA
MSQHCTLDMDPKMNLIVATNHEHLSDKGKTRDARRSPNKSPPPADRVADVVAVRRRRRWKPKETKIRSNNEESITCSTACSSDNKGAGEGQPGSRRHAYLRAWLEEASREQL